MGGEVRREPGTWEAGWPDLAERQRRILLGARLMGVWGRLQREQGVMHLVAARLVDYSELLGGLATRSRDFS